jgi:hypothetical protein
MSSPETVYPPQGLQNTTALNVTGIQMNVLTVKVKNPTITTVKDVHIDQGAQVAAITTVFNISVA